MEIKINSEIDPQNETIIKQHLSSYNSNHTKDIIDCVNDSLEIVLKDNGEVIGGILGRSIWGTLEIQNLALAQNHRGKGLGKQLMLAAESVALERGCKYISLNTFSFQALDFYKHLGFVVFAEEKDFPLGYSKLYLRKEL